MTALLGSWVLFVLVGMAGAAIAYTLGGPFVAVIWLGGAGGANQWMEWWNRRRGSIASAKIAAYLLDRPTR